MTKKNEKERNEISKEKKREDEKPTEEKVSKQQIKGWKYCLEEINDSMDGCNEGNYQLV